jgi:hypothetical protein
MANLDFSDVYLDEEGIEATDGPALGLHDSGRTFLLVDKNK